MDPDPEGPKTCGSGSGFGSGSATLLFKKEDFKYAKGHFFFVFCMGRLFTNCPSWAGGSSWKTCSSAPQGAWEDKKL